MRRDAHPGRHQDSVATVRACTAGALAVIWLILSPYAGAAEDAGIPEPGGLPPDELEVTADTMEMDFAAKIAVFSGNVRVCDSRMTLTSDKMVITLSLDDELKSIEASGHVVIREAKTKRCATAGRAVYDVGRGTIVLTEAPRLSDGSETVWEADRITYFRATERFKLDRGRIKWKPKPGETPLPGFLGRPKEKAPARDGAPEEGENDGPGAAPGAEETE